MKNTITPKVILLSIVYFIIAVFFILLVDLGLYFFFHKVVFNLLDWFNGLSFFFKLLLIIVGGTSLFSIILNLTSTLSSMVGGLIFNRLPLNWFTMISTFLLAIGNAAINIIWLWKIPEHYNLWIICELIILSGFIWSLISIVLPLKEQSKMYGNEDRY